MGVSFNPNQVAYHGMSGASAPRAPVQGQQVPHQGGHTESVAAKDPTIDQPQITTSSFSMTRPSSRQPWKKYI